MKKINLNKKYILLGSILIILLIVISAIGVIGFFSNKILVKNIYVLQNEIKNQQTLIKKQSKTIGDIYNLPDINNQLASYYPGMITKSVRPTENSAIIGNPDAKVTIVEFADFQCPFCEKFFSDNEPDIISKYVNSGKVKFVFENFPFLGAESQAAAEAAKCAGDQGQFWQYHDYLYSHQGKENSGAFSNTNLEKFAKQISGLDSKSFNTCLVQHKEAQTVSNEYQEGVKLNIGSTPTILINGREVIGSYSTQTYENIIDEELNK